MRPIEPEEFAEASRELLASLAPYRLPHQRRRGSERWEATHVLRVRVVSCPDCDTDVYLFLEPLVSVASRASHERDGFFGCTACGTASRPAIPARLRFTLISRDGGLETAFKLDHNVRL
jgi:hypothetical protein